MKTEKIRASIEERDLISVFMLGQPGIWTRMITWNDLMPVVEKIRPLVHKIDTDSTAWRRLSGKSIFAKLEDVYKAVVEFIRWYNSQNS